MHYLKYIWYLIRHKYYVGKECWANKLYWQAIFHDFSKIYPGEFIPYARFFYTDKYKNHSAFGLAWLYHQHRNRHHWQYWLLKEDEGATVPMEMPEKYVKEMLCDWYGAGKAQGFHSPKEDKYLETRNWYNINKHKMILHENTRKYIEDKLSEK